MNKVVLGDLALLTGDDCIRTTNTASPGHALFPELPVPTSSFRVLLELKYLESRANRSGIYGNLQHSVGGYGLVVDSSSLNAIIWVGGVETRWYAGPLVSGNVYTIDFEHNGTTATVSFEGGTQSRVVSLPDTTSVPPKLGAGTQSGWLDGVICEWYSLKHYVDGSLVGDYISNGDYGNPGVPDRSSSSRDGTLSDAQWWKRDVNENYLTPLAYKSAWPDPMEDDQEVVYTDATPYYTADDVFWNPYNQDGTYTFTVSQQLTEVSFGFGMKFNF